MKLTRRKLAAAVLLPAAAAALPQTPAPTQTPEAPRDELALARQRVQASAAALARVDLPMSTEPAFQFKA